MLRCWILVVKCALLGACVSLPPANVTRGATVVVVNIIEPQLTNAHHGITVFGNYNHSIDNDWAIPEYAEKFAIDRLGAAGYQVISVKPDARESESLLAGDYYRISRDEQGRSTWLRELAARKHASAVVILRSFRNTILQPAYGGYGVYSALGAKPDVAFLFAMVGADVLSGDPLQRNRSGERDELRCGSLFHTDKIPVSDLENLKMEHLATYRFEMQRLVAFQIQHTLTVAGLIVGPDPDCELNRI